jgi:hypothetical protein
MSLLRSKKPDHSNPSNQPQPSRLPHRWAIIIGFAFGIGIALCMAVGAAVGVPAAIALAMFLHHALE